MANLTSGLSTIELGRVAWREVINDNLVIIDTFITTGISAEFVLTDTTNFNNNLTSRDDTVQKRLNTLNDLQLATTARETSTDTTNFNGILSSRDDTIQKRLDTIDNLQLRGTGRDISLDTTNFNNNLDSSIDTVQKLAQWINDYNFGSTTPRELLGGDSSTTTFDYTRDGGDSSTTTFDTTFDGGSSI